MLGMKHANMIPYSAGMFGFGGQNEAIFGRQSYAQTEANSLIVTIEQSHSQSTH